jgi:acid phosphatase class B
MVADWNRIVRENPCIQERATDITVTVNELFKKAVHSTHAFRDWFYDKDYLVRDEVLDAIKAGLDEGKLPKNLADELSKAHGGF